jgi:two-component system, chemotaxis family, chemotaxis protein CheY
MFAPETKVLVVDDSPALRQSMIQLLNELNFKNVQEASDGSVAYEMITESYVTGGPFELVICDWHMGQVSGYQLLQQIRQSPAIGELPFIMITVENAVPEVLKAIKGGVSEYIVKPCDLDLLKNKLESAYQRVIQKKK